MPRKEPEMVGKSDDRPRQLKGSDNHYIGVYHDIKFQDGPVKKVGTNGTQLEPVIEDILDYLRRCQKSGPCRETSIAITKFEEGLLWLQHRTAKRVAQNVEGTEAAHV